MEKKLTVDEITTAPRKRYICIGCIFADEHGEAFCGDNNNDFTVDELEKIYGSCITNNHVYIPKQQPLTPEQ